MADVLDRIRKLIALASSSNENEARTAAFLAVKMIREHDVQLSLERAQPQMEFRDMNDFWRGWGAGAAPRRPASRVPKERRQPDELRKDAYGRPWGFYQFSQLEGNCTYCGGWIHRGDPVYWRREDEDGPQHKRCWEVSNPKRAKDFDISTEELDDLFKDQ